MGHSLIPNEFNLRAADGGLDLMGSRMVFWDPVSMSHRGVILIEATHAVHFIVDAAGDVLNVLHVGSETQ